MEAIPLPDKQPQVPQQETDALAAPKVLNVNRPPPPGVQQEVNTLFYIDFPFPCPHISSYSYTVSSILM